MKNRYANAGPQEEREDYFCNLCHTLTKHPGGSCPKCEGLVCENDFWLEPEAEVGLEADYQYG